MVLDTTVLVYAKGSDHPLRDPCRELVSMIAGGEIDATTTVEAIQEFTHVRARRRGAADAAAHGRDYAELLSPLLVVGREQLERGLTLFEATPGIGAFDAVLAASALQADALAIISADLGFATIDGLAHVFPDSEGIDSIRQDGLPARPS